MAAPSTTAPIKQAFVARMRASATLKTAVGGQFAEGLAPEKATYPFVVYNFMPSTLHADMGGGSTLGMMTIARVDVFAFAKSAADAGNVDQLVSNALWDAQLIVDGQTTLYCRRVADLPFPPQLDKEGSRVFQMGGTYEIWTDQQF